MDLSLERKLVFNFPFKGLRYLREGRPPDGSCLVAYTTDEENYFVRQWWLWPVNAWIDGVETPLPQPECRLVNPATIALGVKAYNFVPDNFRLPARPTRLVERWQDFHNSQPRVVHYESWWQTIKRLFR